MFYAKHGTKNVVFIFGAKSFEAHEADDKLMWRKVLELIRFKLYLPKVMSKHKFQMRSSLPYQRRCSYVNIC